MATIAELENLLDLASKELAALKSEEGGDPVAGRFVKFDQDKRLVYAHVYIPDTEDAHGHQMTPGEIEKMAHGFLANANTLMIDVNHDNETDYGCAMVESFIARKGDPDFIEGAWCAAVFVGNDEIWSSIKKGDLTGFSFEGLGYISENDT